MLSLFEQLRALTPIDRLPTYYKRRERMNNIIDVLRDKNATLQTILDTTGMHHTPGKAAINELVEEGRIVHWKVGRTLWYTLSRKELKR